MHFEGKATLKADPLAVWKIVLDVDQFADCMPGVDDVTKVDDHTFDGAMKAKVGPISGDFTFRAQIVESESPSRLVAEVEGKDSLTKSTVTSEIAMTLAELAVGETEVSYKAEVEVRGRLAIIGDMVLRAAGAQTIDEFFRRLRRKVEGAAV